MSSSTTSRVGLVGASTDPIELTAAVVRRRVGRLSSGNCAPTRCDRTRCWSESLPPASAKPTSAAATRTCPSRCRPSSATRGPGRSRGRSAATDLAVGNHVAMTFPSCVQCIPACPARRPTASAASSCRSVVPGATAPTHTRAGVHGHFFGQSSFASFARATECNLVKIDSEMPLQLAGPLGCGVQTGPARCSTPCRSGPAHRC